MAASKLLTNGIRKSKSPEEQEKHFKFGPHGAASLERSLDRNQTDRPASQGVMKKTKVVARGQGGLGMGRGRVVVWTGWQVTCEQSLE